MLMLKDRTAVITGAGSGIGRGLALHAAAQGMSLALADINAQRLEETTCLVSELGTEVISQTLDVADTDAQLRFSNDVFNKFRSVALVFANAGIVRLGSILNLNITDWEKQFSVNTRGVANSISAFIGPMVDRDEPSRFVITGSLASLIPISGMGVYTASKHALWGLAETLAVELRETESPVGVSFICPGGVQTAIGGTPHEVAGYITPAECARRVFAALKEGRFWIYTHPAGLPIVSQRFARALKGEEPRLVPPEAFMTF